MSNGTENFRNFQISGKKDNLKRLTEIFETSFRKFSVPLDFKPEFSEILVEWNAPLVPSFHGRISGISKKKPISEHFLQGVNVIQSAARFYMCNGVYHAYPAEFSRRYLPATFLSFLEFETRENNPKGHSIAQKEDINVVKVMNGSFAFGSHLFSEHSKLINQLEIDFFQLRKSPQYGNCCP